MLDNKLSRLTMHGVIGNSTTINGRYIQCLEPFRYEITCFPLPRFPPFKATANYPRLRWAGLCAEMGHSGPLKFPYLCHARKETRDLMDLSHLSIGLLPAWWFFRLLAWWQWVLGRKYGNQISDKVVSQCACCGTLFFQCFHGWSTDPFRKHRHLQAIWVGIGRFLCGRDASKGGRTLKFKAPLRRSP
jgi:hypothetical protein